MRLLNNWAGGTAEDVFRDFDGSRYSCRDDIPPSSENPAYKDVEILLASYGAPSYEGHAFVLFRRDGVLWEVNASHCSCYGLEDQWCPEETSVAALRYRLDHGSLGQGGWDENPFADELRQVLDEL